MYTHIHILNYVYDIYTYIPACIYVYTHESNIYICKLYTYNSMNKHLYSLDLSSIILSMDTLPVQYSTILYSTQYCIEYYI